MAWSATGVASLLLLAVLQPCTAEQLLPGAEAARHDGAPRRQLQGSTVVTAAPVPEAVNPNLTAAAPDNTLSTAATAQLILQQPPEAPGATAPLPAPLGRRATAASAPGSGGRDLSMRAASAAQLASALRNVRVGTVLLQNNITLSAGGWASSGTVEVGRDVVLAPAAASPAVFLDFGRLPYAIVVQASSTLAFDRVMIQGIASATAGIDTPAALQSSDTFRIVGLPMWPSVGGNPNATVALNKMTVYYRNVENFANCSLFQQRINTQFKLTYGADNVSTPDDTVLVSGRHVIDLPLVPNTGGNVSAGNVFFDTTDVSAACQLSDGRRFPGPPPRARFPAWAGVLIGIGVTMLVVMCVITALLWRRRRRRFRRQDLEGKYAWRLQMQGLDGRAFQLGSDGSKLASTNGTFRVLDGNEKGTPDEFLAALWQGGSQAMGIQASDEVQYHKQLLAMRTGSGLEGIEIGPLLGRGSYGRVYKGRWHGAMVAVKVIDAMPAEDGSSHTDSARESILAASVSHPNVIATYKICAVRMGDSKDSGEVEVPPQVAGLPPPGGDANSDGSATVPLTEVLPGDLGNDNPQGLLETWMLLEFADRGSLEQAIQGNRFRRKGSAGLDMASVYKSLVDVATGMQYLHNLGIVHGDLKPANVLLKSTVSDSRGFICKLADFGLSRILDLNSTHVSTQSIGTVPYMPPELLSTGRMSKAVDAYSFGILMWELLTGSSPYKGMAFGQVMFNVVHGSLRPEIPESCPPEYAELMRRCWADVAAERPAFRDITAALAQQAREAAAAAKAAAAAAAEVAASATAAAAAAAPAVDTLAAQSPAVASFAVDVGGGAGSRSPSIVGSRKQPSQQEAAPQPPTQRRASLHSSLRDLRKAISFSLRPRAGSTSGGGAADESVASSGSSATRAGQPSAAALAALRAAPRQSSIQGEWVPAPRFSSVTGTAAEAGHPAAQMPDIHRKSASAAFASGSNVSTAARRSRRSLGGSPEGPQLHSIDSGASDELGSPEPHPGAPTTQHWH